MNEHLLAEAIVRDAMEEWEKLIRRRLRKDQLNHTTVVVIESRLENLRKFFHSPWCEVLMCQTCEGSEILKRLEAEYQQSKLYKQVAKFKKEARL